MKMGLLEMERRRDSGPSQVKMTYRWLYPNGCDMKQFHFQFQKAVMSDE
jgi:hypothetical protein